MSASTRTVPAQVGWGRFPSALAALALVVILAVSLAIVALGGAKAAPIADPGANTAPFLDRGSRDEMYKLFPAVPFLDKGGRGENAPAIKTDDGSGGFGGWGGPVLTEPNTHGGFGPGLRAE